MDMSEEDEMLFACAITINHENKVYNTKKGSCRVRNSLLPSRNPKDSKNKSLANPVVQAGPV